MHIIINNYFLKGDYMKNLKSYREYLEYVYSNEFSIGNMLPQVPLSEKSNNEKTNKVIKNDKGQIVPTVCPKCGSKNLTKIDRMNGYLAYSRVKGDSRLADHKMAEIKDRVSM